MAPEQDEQDVPKSAPAVPEVNPSPIRTRANAKHKRISDDSTATVPPTPELARGRGKDLSPSTSTLISPIIPVQNRYEALYGQDGEQEDEEQERESVTSSSSKESASSFSRCVCKAECFEHVRFGHASARECKYRCSCSCEKVSESAHTCERCLFYWDKCRNNPEKQRTYAQVLQYRKENSEYQKSFKDLKIDVKKW